MKVQVPVHPVSGAPAYEIDTLNLAHRVDDIVGRLDVAAFAVRGANADLWPIAAFIEEVRDQVKAVSADMHPDHQDDDPGALEEDEDEA